MKGLTFYRFQSEWSLDAPYELVFEALKDLEGYVAWWPEVKDVKRIGEGRFEVVARATLPYELRFISSQSVLDEKRGILEAGLRGDLNGFTRWTLSQREGATIAVFDEEVHTGKRLLNVLAPVARPAFRYNHTLMMRHGQEGLRRLLA
ncbi:MAG: polyketide cyclase [Actinomycetota bacterium]|nr:polyketide cyclase [Actinomycetota bacterium]